MSLFFYKLFITKPFKNSPQGNEKTYLAQGGMNSIIYYWICTENAQGHEHERDTEMRDRQRWRENQ